MDRTKLNLIALAFLAATILLQTVPSQAQASPTAEARSAKVLSIVGR